MKRINLILSIVLGLINFGDIQAQQKNKTVLIDYHQNAPTKFIEAGGTKYAYRSFGNNTGIPLLLLQHFTGTLDNWDPAITNGLARHFQVILFDNKGIGASQGQTPDNIEAMAQDAISFIKALGLKKVNILGFSMGGFIAQQLILDEPALVNKLILAGTGPKGGTGIADIITPLTASSKLGDNDQKLFLFYTHTSASRKMGQQALNRIYKRKKNRDRETTGPAIQAQLKSILSWGQPDAEALNNLKKIKLPVLVINGSHDIVVPTINSYVLFQNLVNARLSLYPDSGHGSIFQFPELFLNEAVSFLQNN
ncbi:pimeloyl-ACP methyl ester carboxylesterase [Pedobacter cryoconitis]|uniref:alpha/beta fold hydrolase n=1 Tax=Pedobacter cryoconitis TaxID=188932 RepID=UPI00160D6666|nr:alpha/beta hydrolase [Pedobacter cryoconitis]MBB6271737.1 pimeloyl-ACP methyl ester carboxylesterase [Pedobacter cryoconitis]